MIRTAGPFGLKSAHTWMRLLGSAVDRPKTRGRTVNLRMAPSERGLYGLSGRRGKYPGCVVVMCWSMTRCVGLDVLAVENRLITKVAVLNRT